MPSNLLNMAMNHFKSGVATVVCRSPTKLDTHNVVPGVPNHPSRRFHFLRRSGRPMNFGALWYPISTLQVRLLGSPPFFVFFFCPLFCLSSAHIFLGRLKGGVSFSEGTLSCGTLN